MPERSQRILHILSRKNEERDQRKADTLAKQKATRMKFAQIKKQKAFEWQKKMKRSPYRVDQLGENERIDEVGGLSLIVLLNCA